MSKKFVAPTNRPVRVLNPLPGGRGWTSLERALRFERKGLARLSECKTRLHFIEEGEHQVTPAARAHQATEGYNARGLLTIQEVRRIPCAQPDKAFTLPTKTRIYSPGRTGKPEVIVRDGTFAWPAQKIVVLTPRKYPERKAA